MPVIAPLCLVVLFIFGAILTFSGILCAEDRHFRAYSICATLSGVVIMAGAAGLFHYALKA